LLALLADRVGGVDVAEDCLQDAYTRAAVVWPRDGLPAAPAAWIYTVARNAGIDRLRRTAVASRRLAGEARILDAGVADRDPAQEPDDVSARGVAEYAEVGDETLRLMLLCCHPALARDAQVALTLRLVGGLTTEEIAAAYLVPEATIAQRIVRAKRKIRGANIPLTIPADLSERAETLATVLGLVFNEGYLAHTAAAGRLTRAELADQAIRLTATAADALPGQPELGGLLAVELFHRSREDARTDAQGALVRLADQDRARWDRNLIRQGFAALSLALAQRRIGPWQIQGLIAAEHATGHADWRRIVRLYDRLMEMTPGPVVELNRAVAVAEAQGPDAGLAAVQSVSGLGHYHLWHAALAEMYDRVGLGAQAHESWRHALALTRNPAEAAFVAARAAEHLRDLSPPATAGSF